MNRHSIYFSARAGEDISGRMDGCVYCPGCGWAFDPDALDKAGRCKDCTELEPEDEE